MSELKKCVGKDSLQSHLVRENESINDRLKDWKKNILKSYLIHFLMGSHFISGVLMPFFMNWGRLTFVEVMFLQSYFTLMILILEIPCGAIADYISRKFSLFLGALITALAAVIYGSYPNIIIFMIGETLFAAGNALISGTDQAFTYDTLRKMGEEEKIAKIMGHNRSFMLAGIAISAPIGSLIGYFFALPLVMTMMFIPFIGAMITAISLKEPNITMEKEKKESYYSVAKSGFIELVKNKTLRLLAIDLVLTQSVIFFLVWIYQIYLELMAFQMVFFGFVSTAMTVIQIIFNNLAPRIEKRFKRKKLFLQIYTMIPGIGFILMAFIFFVPVSIALILIVIGLGFSRHILFIKGINKQIKTENRATVLSTINMITCLLRTVLYPIIGFLVMWNIRITFIFLGLVVILFAIFTKMQDDFL
ncbi:MAG: MFS transporter [Promethearchaeota archaeon]